jgi:hypothetical protein
LAAAISVDAGNHIVQGSFHYRGIIVDGHFMRDFIMCDERNLWHFSIILLV